MSSSETAITFRYTKVMSLLIQAGCEVNQQVSLLNCFVFQTHFEGGVLRHWNTFKLFIRILMVGLPCTRLPIGLKGRPVSCWRTLMSTWTSRTALGRHPLTSLTLTYCGYLRSWKRNRTTAVKTGQILSTHPELLELYVSILNKHLALIIFFVCRKAPDGEIIVRPDIRALITRPPTTPGLGKGGRRYVNLFLKYVMVWS